MKILLILLLIAAAGSLFAGLYTLIKDGSGTGRTARMLTYRVGFSAALFILLMIAVQLGWIQPRADAPAFAARPAETSAP
jgi:hypothetical protein